MAAAAPAAHPPPPLVVGANGRVGSALLRMAPSAVAVGRGHSLATFLGAGSAAPMQRRPILVATTNDALEQVIAYCPAAHRADLVFLQNGMLLPMLEGHGLQGSTQALLYFSASGDGGVVDSGRTVVTGRWANALSEVLRAGGVACRPVERGEFLALMVEKLLWASIYWLLSACLGGLPVGPVAQQHGEAAEELTAELLPLAQAYVLRSGAGAGLPPGSLDQVAALTVPDVCRSMAAYSMAIPTAVPSAAMAMAEFEWRNGWFLGQAATPRHVAWLQRAGVRV